MSNELWAVRMISRSIILFMELVVGVGFIGVLHMMYRGYMQVYSNQYRSFLSL